MDSRKIREFLVIYITFNKRGANFLDRKFREFYTYFYETFRFCNSRKFIEQKNSSETNGNFLSSKLVIFGIYFANSFFSIKYTK